MIITEKSREIYNKLATGWNTWDVRSVTAHVFLPDQLRININFFITNKNKVAKDHAWEHVDLFGEHAADGSYTDLTVRLSEAKCRIETASTNRELVIRVTPVNPAPNYFISLSVEPIWDSKLTIGYKNSRNIVAYNGADIHNIRCLSAEAFPIWKPISAHQLICDANYPAYFSVNNNLNEREIDAFIDDKKSKWLSSTVDADGELSEALSAMRRCLLWNTIYDSIHKRVLTPVSRNWCRQNGGFGEYVVFGWDTFFAGLQMGLVDRDLAYANIFSILEEITPEGMIPNFGSATGWSRDRSEPQVGSLCVWKLYLQYKDIWFIEECYDRLLLWNNWRFDNRDCNGDGLLELASVPWILEKNDGDWGTNKVGAKQGAMWESGLDNSPMWDRAKFNEEKFCMELSYVGLNALMVADCQLLAKMAKLLNKRDDEAALLARAKALGDRINDNLWDDGAGCYLNKHWSGKFDPCLSLTHFYTLTAGIVPENRMEPLTDMHLFNPDEFWNEYVIPNVSRTDPGFLDQDYWRGRIWAPTNFIVAEGLLRAGLLQKRSELSKKGLDMFLRCWREKGIVGENYNAITGEAAETGKASDRFYHWGALLVYLALEEYICFNAWTDEIEINRSDKHVYRIPLNDGKKVDI